MKLYHIILMKVKLRKTTKTQAARDIRVPLNIIKTITITPSKKMTLGPMRAVSGRISSFHGGTTICQVIRVYRTQTRTILLLAG